MMDPSPIHIPPDSEGLYLFPVYQMIRAMEHRSHPYSPCLECIIQPMCDRNEHLFKCSPYSDYFNALIHKDPTIVCTFIINSDGVGQPFTFNGSKNCTIEDLIQESIGKEDMSNGAVFEYDKHLKYTKHLESLEYYDLL